MQSLQTVEQRSGAGAGGLVRRDWRRGGVRWLAVLAGLLLFPLHVGAQGAGDLDISFGDSGVVLTEHHQNHGNVDAQAVALQPDGKIVVVGQASNSPTDISDTDFVLVRYQSNSTLDTTFGGTGQVTTDFGRNTFDSAQAVALQPDGKIVVAGGSLNPSNDGTDYALARYRPNGMLDTTFGSDGRVITERGLAIAIALQPDGKIIVADYSHGGLARYRPNGALDTTFGSDGLVTSQFQVELRAMTLQPDGKIVVAGYIQPRPNTQHHFAVLRYRSNGTLDTTFGSDGLVITEFGEHSTANAVAVRPDGKIIAVGPAYDDSTSRTIIALARYLPNGTLDTTFGSDGLVTSDFGDSDFGDSNVAVAVALQLNGKIVVAGYTADGFRPQYLALARYLPNGMLDTIFGSDGRVITELRILNGLDLVIQPHDGRLVVAGGVRAVGESGFSMFALARYHAIICNEVVVTRVGTAGNDTIMGTSGNDVISGFGGNDLISGLGGNDILCGGSGHDTLRGGSGNDLLDGDAGTDKCNGGSGSSDQAVACEQVTNVP